MEDDKLLVQIAQMYYMENKTQSEISRALHIHRSTISRMLKQCRDQGIVTISINPQKAGTDSLETRLKETYNLKEAIVVPVSSGFSDMQKMEGMGQAANRYLQSILQDHMTIGFSWGKTTAAIVQYFKDNGASNITCVPLIGGVEGRIESSYHVNTVTYEASRHLNGSALLIDAPAFASSPEIRDILLSSEFNQTLIKYWKHTDIAFVGIGSLKASNSRWHFYYGDKIFKNVELNHITGDVCAHYFDKQGQHIPSSLDDLLISISIEDLKKIPYRIGVAESIDKAEAIKAAMLGNYINVLITTSETAEQIV